MCKVSIVVPHRNSLVLINRLLMSIPDNRMFEVIVVDDGSSYECQQLMRSSGWNSNVTVYFSDCTRGAGWARNFGITKATGTWLLFADADDFFVPNMHSLLSSYLLCDADVIFFATSSIYNKTGDAAYRHLRYSEMVRRFLEEGGVDHENSLRFQFTPPWAKLIRRELVIRNSLTFEEIPASNDMMFSVRLGCLADKITACNAVLYVVTVTEGSITNSISKENFLSSFFAVLRVNKFLKKRKLFKYQMSVLYYVYKSAYFGLWTFGLVVVNILKTRSNILIGSSKIFKINKAVKERETR